MTIKIINLSERLQRLRDARRSNRVSEYRSQTPEDDARFIRKIADMVEEGKFTAVGLSFRSSEDGVDTVTLELRSTS